MVRRFEIGNATGNHHLHALYRIATESGERVEARRDCAHRRDCLQDAVVVHRFDWQADRSQVEVAFHYLRTDLANECFERTAVLRNDLLVLQCESTIAVTH